MKMIRMLLIFGCIFPLSAQEFIHDWLVLGSFYNSDRSILLKTDYLNGESRVDPVLAAPCGNLFWLHRHQSGPALDLAASDLPFDYYENAVAYAATWVYSPSTQQAQLLCGSDDGLMAWLNGDLLLYKHRFHRMAIDDDTAEVTLKPGWNKLLLKISNGSGEWQVCARLQGAQGLVLNHHPDQQKATPETAPLVVYHMKIAEGFVLDSLDAPLLSARIGLLAQRNTETVKLELAHNAATSLRFTIPPQTAGDLYFIDIRLPLEVVCRSAGALNWKATENTRTYILSAALPSEFELVYTWFQPWQLEGWRRSGSQTFERKLRFPPILAGCRAAAMVDIGLSWGQVTGDGILLKSRFSRDSGDLPVVDIIEKTKTHTLQVRIDSGKTQLLKSRLQLHHTEIEDYLYSKKFTASMNGLHSSSMKELDAQLLGLLCAGRVEEAPPLLAKAVPLIQESAAQYKKYSVSLLGNAHIDLMWLWRYPETIDVIKNTFTSALNLMEKYPDFRFVHGQAQSYIWMEQLEPELFAKVKRRIEEGRWEIIGGSWSQPDKNMPSGESLVRQYLYGKKYFREKFGQDVAVGFMPDTFGHAATLPQILKKCGIDNYIFFRPFEEERLFYWRSPDGSTVLAYRPPEWYNTSITPDIGRLAMTTEKKFGVPNTLRCYGVGDHGGGPTERDVQLAMQLNRTIGYPNVVFSNIHAYFNQIRPQTTKLDTVQDELNFVFDGCWTSQAMTKKYNRKLEALLPGAETFAVFAQRYGAAYPQTELEKAWQDLLLNQFHDIFDGSGIAAIYPDVLRIYQHSDSLGRAVLQRSLATLAQHINIQAPRPGLKPILLFNQLNQPRREPITLTVDVAPGNSAQFFDEKGQKLAAVKEADQGFSLVTPEVPAFGYTTIFYQAAPAKQNRISQRNLILQNRFLRVEVNHKTGHVVSIYDRRLARELLRGPANLLQLQADDNKTMTAWTIKLLGDITTLDKPIATRIVESNDLRKVMRVVYQSGPSRFEQDIILYADLSRVDFCLRVDWHHRDTMLKVALPLNVDGQACFDIPFGHIVREQTGGEVVSQKWVDLSEERFGIALLNDCKYGYDVKNNVVRLSALRSPHDPDSTADRGYHEMRYALMPHEGDWRKGQVVAAANSYNTPIWSQPTQIRTAELAMRHSFLTIEGEGVMVSACKKAEHERAMILRLVETTGERTTVRLDLGDGSALQELNMIEEKIRDLPAIKGAMTLQLLPYEVRTIAVY